MSVGRTLLLASAWILGFVALGAGSPAVRESLAFADRLPPWATGALALVALGAAIRGAAPRTLLPVAAAAGILGWVAFAELENTVSRVTDFGTFHAASRALFSGTDPYSATDGAFFYPPTFAFLFGPFALAPPALASLLWFLLKLAGFVATVRWAGERLEADLLAPRWRALFVMLPLAATARFWVADFQYGNTNLLLLFLLVASLHLDLEGRSFAAGALLALAGSIKLVPLVFGLWFLARRRWSTLGAGAAALLLFNLLPAVVMTGSAQSAWSGWLETGVAGKLTADLAQPDNQSLRGFLARALPQSPQVARALWVVASLAAGAAVTAFAWRRSGQKGPAQVTTASLYFALMLVVSPGSWVVHYCGAYLLVATLVRFALSAGPYRRTCGVVFGASFLAWTVSGWFRPLIRPSLEQSWFLLALVAVAITVALTLEARGSRPFGGPA